jgi:tRNA threonylcarbamoyladenosine modification (KEOPS) complex  Pcc1 subunit
MPRATAILRINFKSNRQLNAVAEALKPEIAHSYGIKAQATLTIRKTELILKFEGKNSTTLRAITISYLRMLRTSLDACNVVLHSGQKQPEDQEQ